VRDEITRELNLIIDAHGRTPIGLAEAIEAWKQVERVPPQDRIDRGLMSIS
jgi:hypothetical protein